MIETEQLTHHQQTLRLWEAMGKVEASSAPRDVERRRRPRFLMPHSACQLDLLAMDRPETIEVAIRDICASGACLLSHAALPIMQAVRLHPPGDAPNHLEAVLAHVTSCRKRQESYRVGVRFDDA